MDIRLDKKIAIVTGSATGIGKAIAAEMHASGANVVIADINMDMAQDTAGALGDRAQALHLDLGDVGSCKQLITQVIAQYGQLDILVNNGAICPLREIDDVDQAFFDLIIDVNLRGAYFLSQGAAQHMKARHTGRIINVSSVGARTGGKMPASVYSAAKSALFSVTKSFAAYLAPHGTANTIAPGPSRTALTDAWDAEEALEEFVRAVPLGRLGMPQDYAGAAVFLASDYASYITGATVDVNGGIRME